MMVWALEWKKTPMTISAFPECSILLRTLGRNAAENRLIAPAYDAPFNYVLS